MLVLGLGLIENKQQGAEGNLENQVGLGAREATDQEF